MSKTMRNMMSKMEEIRKVGKGRKKKKKTY